jgi:hypothetical protein
MKILAQQILILTTSVCLIPLLAFAQIGNSGKLLLHIVDPSGRPVTPNQIQVTDASGRVSSVKAGEEDTSIQLPYGDFQIRVHVPGFLIWTEKINIHGPLTRITAGMKLGGIEGPDPTCSVEGAIEGKVTNGWVRLMGVFVNEIIETSFSDKGVFQLGGAQCGSYILAVVEDEKVVYLGTINLKTGMTPLTIKLMR